jgi:hypothetical protein
VSPLVFYALALRAVILDVYARRWTCSTGLADLLEPHTGYSPSLYPGPFATKREAQELRDLADGYDAAQELRGDPRRAYRGMKMWWRMLEPVRRRVPARQPRGRTAQLDLQGIPALQRGHQAALAGLRRAS